MQMSSFCEYQKSTYLPYLPSLSSRIKDSGPFLFIRKLNMRGYLEKNAAFYYRKTSIKYWLGKNIDQVLHYQIPYYLSGIVNQNGIVFVNRYTTTVSY